MAASQQLLAEFQDFESEGAADASLRGLYLLKEYQHADPECFLNMLLGFLKDARALLEKMDVNVRGNVIDFAELTIHSEKLHGSSASLGALRLKRECCNVQLAAENCSKDECVRAFIAVKREYAVVKPHLEAIIELEREIIANGNSANGNTANGNSLQG